MADEEEEDGSDTAVAYSYNRGRIAEELDTPTCPRDPHTQLTSTTHYPCPGTKHSWAATISEHSQLMLHSSFVAMGRDASAETRFRLRLPERIDPPL